MFEIDVKVVDEKHILVIDVTRTYNKLPAKVNSLVMSIQSSKISGGIVEDINVIQYLMNNRYDNELYNITAETLGLTAGVNIPDGIYYIKLVVNGIEAVEASVVVLTEIQKSIQTLGTKFDFDIDIKNNSLFTQNMPLSDDVLRYNYAMALYLSLMWETGNTNGQANVNDHIDKLQRILNIVLDDTH